MKLNRFGVFATFLAGTAFVGCSSDKSGPSEESGTLSFDLTTAEGVVITTVNYNLNTQGGADVASGAISVPNPNSTISLGIESLPAPASYSLAFSAVGMYNGTSVPCVSVPTSFALASGQDLTLPTINLVCTIEGAAPDTTGSANANVNVVVEQISVNNNIVEVFSYGPRSVRGLDQGGVCTFPPIQLNVFNNNTAITYAWAAAPDGTLAMNASSTAGTYTCASGGDKTLTVTATMGATTASKSVTVNCDASACGIIPIVCGDGLVQGTEECDENTPRCTSCVITPSCGDGVVDGPNGDCAGTNISKPSCNEACDTSGPSATCDVNCQIAATCTDGIQNQGEGGIDCGGPCPACPTLPTCTDGLQNQGETGVDCGGPCPACPTLPTCTDGLQNQGETGVDCGGPCPACVAGGAACRACFMADAEIGPFQAEACDIAPECLSVELCVMDNTECLVPIPGECYCGPAVEQCRNPAFVPTGPCVPELRAGTGNPATNAEVLDRMTNTDFPAGVAMLIIDAATRNCPAPACPFQP